jgi:hypothetical protein
MGFTLRIKRGEKKINKEKEIAQQQKNKRVKLQTK